MFCKKCGKEISNEALFCPNCNSILEIASKGKANEKSDLPPIPPSFTRPIPINELSRSRRKKLKPPHSRGTGCLVFSLLFLLLCIGFVASLFISDKIKEKSLGEPTTVSSTETSAAESTTVLKTEIAPQTTKPQNKKSETKKDTKN